MPSSEDRVRTILRQELLVLDTNPCALLIPPLSMVTCPVLIPFPLLEQPQSIRVPSILSLVPSMAPR